jgi:hypothetical protein
MSASNRTVEAILKVVQKHAGDEITRKIIKDLLDVPGNASFRDTVVKLANLTGVDQNSARKV